MKREPGHAIIGQIPRGTADSREGRPMRRRLVACLVRSAPGWEIKGGSPWLVCGALVCALTMPVVAHHSPAAFDRTKQVTLIGTVKEFRWQNPHT